MSDTLVMAGQHITLGDMLDLLDTGLGGTIKIFNECDEVLVILQVTPQSVVPLTKVLSRELLQREVLRCGNYDGESLFKVKGVEDAE